MEASAAARPPSDACVRVPKAGKQGGNPDLTRTDLVPPTPFTQEIAGSNPAGGTTAATAAVLLPHGPARRYLLPAGGRVGLGCSGQVRPNEFATHRINWSFAVFGPIRTRDLQS
jgi:hypothetical protein